MPKVTGISGQLCGVEDLVKEFIFIVPVSHRSAIRRTDPLSLADQYGVFKT
jgi:hypothetical protein